MPRARTPLLSSTIICGAKRPTYSPAWGAHTVQVEWQNTYLELCLNASVNEEYLGLQSIFFGGVTPDAAQLKLTPTPYFSWGAQKQARLEQTSSIMLRAMQQLLNILKHLCSLNKDDHESFFRAPVSSMSSMTLQ